MGITEERFEILKQKIKSPKFLENRGMANEVGYHIFDYPAEDEMYVREQVKIIQKRSEEANDEYKIIVFDLYDIMIEILEKKKYLEKCYAMEKKNGFARTAGPASSGQASSAAAYRDSDLSKTAVRSVAQIPSLSRGTSEE